LVEQTRLQLGQGLSGQAALEGRTIFIPDLHDRGISDARLRHLAGVEHFVTYFSVPLMIKGEIKGVLELFLRSEFMPTSDWQEFFDSLARQAAIAIDNAQLFDSLQHSRVELAMAYDFTLEGWSRAVDMRDEETETHTKRVVDMTVQLARRSGFKEEDLVHVRRGALLHDIGKMGVPDQVLQCTGKLDEKQWIEMRKHPGYAKQFIEDIDYLRPAIDIPYCHHERWNGSGYPRGLKGEEIPKAARIFAVVDVYDALINDRRYRKAWPKEQVLAYLREKKGIEFDPTVVDSFIELLEEESPDR
jgi:putative nucleotidyltransferase with HDIG domain